MSVQLSRGYPPHPRLVHVPVRVQKKFSKISAKVSFRGRIKGACLRNRQLPVATFFEVRCQSLMRFEVKLRGEIIGISELEGGDPPMGVAFGRLLPTPAYTSIQPYCIEHRDYWKLIPELTVQEPGGVQIECSGGVQIIDFSPELGEEGIQVHVNGIPYPLYGELFPQHVALYREQFK